MRREKERPPLVKRKTLSATALRCVKDKGS